MRRLAPFVLVLGLGLSVVLAACGDDDNGSGGPVATTAATTAAPTSTAASAPVAIRVTQNVTLGPILVDAQGRTVYRFTRDTAGVSNCEGTCAQTWPPVVADSSTVRGEGVTGQVTVIQRKDGTQQVAYEGMPLYRYAPDQAQGDTKGQNVGGVWFVVKPTDKAAYVPSRSGTTAVAVYSY